MRQKGVRWRGRNSEKQNPINAFGTGVDSPWSWFRDSDRGFARPGNPANYSNPSHTRVPGNSARQSNGQWGVKFEVLHFPAPNLSRSQLPSFRILSSRTRIGRFASSASACSLCAPLFKHITIAENNLSQKPLRKIAWKLIRLLHKHTNRCPPEWAVASSDGVDEGGFWTIRAHFIYY